MKRIIILILTICVLFLLTSCVKGQKNESGPRKTKNDNASSFSYEKNDEKPEYESSENNSANIEDHGNSSASGETDANYSKKEEVSSDTGAYISQSTDDKSSNNENDENNNNNNNNEDDSTGEREIVPGGKGKFTPVV